MAEEASWDEYAEEEATRARVRKETAARTNVPVVWDDADERKCQEMYRKKYSK